MRFKLLPDAKSYLDTLNKETSVYLENVSFDELTEDEKESVIKGRQEYNNGEYIDFEDYINERV